jgi:hypothetical protein
VSEFVPDEFPPSGRGQVLVGCGEVDVLADGYCPCVVRIGDAVSVNPHR